MRSDNLPIVLMPVHYYLPAYKAGGPIRTLSAMAEMLSGEFRFKIIACCHDLKDAEPFEGVRLNAWNGVGTAEVMYLRTKRGAGRSVTQAIRETEHDLLYLNSMFDLEFTIAPLWARRRGTIAAKPVILAPRGELSLSALSQKGNKKRIFLKIARALKLYERITWHASTDEERKEIAAALEHLRLDKNGSIHVARNLAVHHENAPRPRAPKQPGRLRAVYLARIAPIKNLLAAIDFVSQLKGEACLDIYGVIDDRAYWSRCEAAIARHGGGNVLYKGAIRHEDVAATLSRYDAFVLPTFSENFGHGILESMLAGCPVVISDRTLWCDLQEKDAGWDLPLDQPERFRAALQELTDQDEETHRRLREGARDFALRVVRDDRAVSDNKFLFNRAMNMTTRPEPIRTINRQMRKPHVQR